MRAFCAIIAPFYRHPRHEIADMIDPVPASATVPDDFIALVRDALAHMYDHAHLETHPLVSLLSPSDTQTDAQALRYLLLDTLEAIRPADHLSRNDSSWRPYHILIQRYVDGFEVDDILADLHTSLRQFQRDHRKGLLAVATMLWHRWQETNQDASGAPDNDRPPELEALANEMAQLGLQLEQLNLLDVVNGVLNSVAVLAREMGVYLDVRPARQPVFIWADRTLTRQALMGAMSAMVAVGPRQLRMTWSATPALARFDLLIEPPLLEDDASQVSELLTRLDMISALCKAQGGQFQVLRQGHNIRGALMSLPGTQRPLVLVIDDNQRMLQLFERYLVSEGYGFQGATGAQEALEALDDIHPDAIILDIMMRDVDGWQLLQTLRARPGMDLVPVIICSILDETDLAKALGADYYIKKPVSQENVLSAVRAALAVDSSAERRPTAR
jgi:CheY-like chemotaxis protein